VRYVSISPFFTTNKVCMYLLLKGAAGRSRPSRLWRA
jgi:hypothetical protein